MGRVFECLGGKEQNERGVFMRLNRCIRIVAAWAVIVVVYPAKAQFGGGVVVCTNCATEPTAVSIKIMHDLEYAKQILQYAVQVQQLADAIKNTAHGGGV